MERSSLRCKYHSTSKWLELGPFKIEVNSNDPFHLTIKELLQPNEGVKITQGLSRNLTSHKDRRHGSIKNGDWTDVRVMKK